MSESNFTPGPWKVVPWRITTNPDDEIVAVQRGQEGGFSVHAASGHKRALADAHLIAAAPDLYEALEMLCDAVDGNYKELVDIADKALKKARGDDEPCVPVSRLPVTLLKLSIRSQNILRISNINTLEQLTQNTIDDLLRRRITKEDVCQIAEELNKFKLSLKSND